MPNRLDVGMRGLDVDGGTEQSHLLVAPKSVKNSSGRETRQEPTGFETVRPRLLQALWAVARIANLWSAAAVGSASQNSTPGGFLI